MYIVIERSGAVSSLEYLDGDIQQRILEGEIDVVDCEEMSISNGYGFDPIPAYYDD